MLTFTIRRLLISIPTLIFISLIIFLLLNLAPNDPMAQVPLTVPPEVKEKMREEGAIYGGEMSAHHYFRDFFYCDSGMIPWLLVVALMVKKDKPLSTLVDQAIEAFPASGEINCNVADAERLKNELMAIYADDAQSIDLTDGLSIEFKEWRFNVRASNTEAVVRLNLETRADSALLKEKTEEILGHIRKG